MNELILNDKFISDKQIEEDEIPMVEDYFRIVAEFLRLKAGSSTPNTLKNLFEKESNFALHLRRMKSKILEDDLFD